MNKQVRFTTALALGAVVLSIPTLAIAQPTVEIGDPASLVAKGVGAIVSVEVTCDSVAPTNTTFVFLELLQGADKTINGGSGSAGNFNCSSTPQTVEVLVTTFNKLFKPGRALARAFLQACLPDFSVCENAEAAEEIRLKK